MKNILVSFKAEAVLLVLTIMFAPSVRGMDSFSSKLHEVKQLVGSGDMDSAMAELRILSMCDLLPGVESVEPYGAETLEQLEVTLRYVDAAIASDNWELAQGIVRKAAGCTIVGVTFDDKHSEPSPCELPYRKTMLSYNDRCARCDANYYARSLSCAYRGGDIGQCQARAYMAYLRCTRSCNR